MTPSVRAVIDLGAIESNLRLARTLAPASRVLAMIKANAYGHGLVSVARFLSSRADALAVARVEEALWLREAGVQGRIVAMSGAQSTSELRALLSGRIDVALHHLDQVDMICREQPVEPMHLWIKYDSGMHRLGFDDAEFGQANALLHTHVSAMSRIYLTHFACSDEPLNQATASQWEKFHRAVKGLPGELSAANSAAVLHHHYTHADWIRPGVMLYGVHPGGPSQHIDALRPAMTLSARLVAVRQISAGESVGYGKTWTAKRESKIGTIAIGYGDGYPRHARNGTPVAIRGKRVPLVGRVSMDLITVDLTEHPEARIGDEAELWGGQISVNEVAACSDTIGYELLTGISPRVRCEYLVPHAESHQHTNHFEHRLDA